MRFMQHVVWVFAAVTVVAVFVDSLVRISGH